MRKNTDLSSVPAIKILIGACAGFDTSYSCVYSRLEAVVIIIIIITYRRCNNRYYPMA